MAAYALREPAAYHWPTAAGRRTGEGRYALGRRDGRTSVLARWSHSLWTERTR
jgi:hypothetical protein